MLEIITIATIGVAFICSLSSFRLHMGLHLKALSILLGITFFVEFFCAFLITPLGLKTNVHIYNVFVLFEFWGFAYYYFLLLKNKIVKHVIRAFLVVFPIVWYILVFKITGLYTWNSYVQVIGHVFIIGLSIYYYFTMLVADEVISLKTKPEFWIATGMIIFYSCNLPYLGMLNYLYKSYESLSEKFLSVLELLDIIMYSLFTYAYLCQYKTTQKQKLPSVQQ